MLKPFISLLLFSLIAIISIDKTNNKAMANTEPNILISFIAIYMFCLELRKMVVSSAN